MNRLDIKPGDKIGRLTVVAEIPKDPNGKNQSLRERRRFLFSCECGGETTTTWGSAQSCGCLQREIAKRIGFSRRKPEGEACMHALWVGYINSSTQRALEFTLTKDEFKTITSSNCFYCGSEPKAVKKGGRFRKWNGEYYYNGIDRVDNMLGYTVANSVPCCFACNQAKHVSMQPVFFDWIKRVHANLNLKGLL
jgi:hypothetical protein